jgi:hypothetical protein
MIKYNVYKGRRYVPLIEGTWNVNKTYEALTVVMWQGASYTSKKDVPKGIYIGNEDYWVLTGNYNAQVEMYRNEVKNKVDKVDFNNYYGTPINKYERYVKNNDYTIALQKALDEHDVVILEPKEYKVTGTITLHKNNRLMCKNYAYSGNINRKYCRINHAPSSLKDLFIYDNASLENGYVYNITLENIELYGNQNSNCGINMLKGLSCNVSNVVIQNFNIGVQCNFLLGCNVDNSHINNCTTAIKFTGGVSTTSNFNHLWIQESVIGIDIADNTAYGIIFNEPIIENSDFAGNFGLNNNVILNNIYTENIPRTETNTPLFKLGTDSSSTAFVSNYYFNGGLITGFNGVQTGKYNARVFSADKVKNLTVVGVEIRRIRQLIDTTINTTSCNFIGVNLNDCDMYGGNVYDRGALNFVSSRELISKQLIIANRFDDPRGWKLTSEFANTKTDLNFYRGSKIVFGLDDSGNVRLSDTPVKALKGAVVLPKANTQDFTGFVGNASYIRKVTGENGVERDIPLMRNTQNKNLQMAIPSGSTGSRPSRAEIVASGIEAFMYFDTGIKKLIIFDMGTLEWRDTLGTVV